MSERRPMRRDMSYRKPVPKFIPSPPPSPRSEPPNSPYNRQSFLMESPAMYNDMPPLPSGWRDAIDKATSKDKWTFGGAMADVEGSSGNRSPSMRSASSRREQVSSLSMNDGFDSYSMSDYGDEGLVAPSILPISWVQSPRTSRKRTLPLDYRPPTPPLPAYVKHGRLPQEDSTDTFPSMDYHVIYPDPPSVLDLHSFLPRAPIDEKTSNGDRPDLLPATSFQSETTQSSSVTTQSSLSNPVNPPISDARETWLRDTWCILPMLPIPTGDRHSGETGLQSQSLGVSNQARRFWERLAMLGNSLRTRLRAFRVAPLSNWDCDSISLA